MALHHSKILKGTSETDRLKLFQSTAVIKPTFQARYRQLHEAIVHTRAMRREFVHNFGHVTNSKPAVLREAYKRLTGDRSAASSLTEEEVDARLSEMLELEDPDVLCDLRVNNPGRPQEYTEFQVSAIH